jgi:hypothetical protein
LFRGLVGSEMCIRDRITNSQDHSSKGTPSPEQAGSDGL